MRFMVLVPGDERTEAGVMPTRDELAAVGEFNEKLAEAGVMVAGEGLHPTSKGKRIRFGGDEQTIIDGPFAEAKEIVAGFWIIDAKSIDDAVEWMRRAPFGAGVELEIRQVFEEDDFGEEFTPELREQEQRIRQRVESEA